MRATENNQIECMSVKRGAHIGETLLANGLLSLSLSLLLPSLDFAYASQKGRLDATVVQHYNAHFFSLSRCFFLACATQNTAIYYSTSKYNGNSVETTISVCVCAQQQQQQQQTRREKIKLQKLLSTMADEQETFIMAFTMYLLILLLLFY